jgi:uncharacterized protein (TIRG00374 family)
VANSVPAGGAIALGLTYTMLSSWGFSKSRATVSIVGTGIWNNFVKLGTQTLAVFAFARLLTAIPLTPGGVGVVELALIAGISRGGGDDAEVVAAVLLFRLLTFVLPILVGAFTYRYWRVNRSWLDSAPPFSPERMIGAEA